MGASPKARQKGEDADFGERSGCCRGKRCAVVGLLLSMNLFEAMNGTLTGLLIPVIANDFGCSTEVAAWISLGPSFTSAMLGPPIGMVADTIGRTKVWRIFAGVLMVMLPVCGFATSVFMLIIARTIGGMSWAGCGPAGFAIMAQGVEPSRRGIISAWQQATGMFGGSCGTALGGIMISVMGWRSVFLVSMIPITSIWLLNFLILPRDAPMSRAELSEKIRTFDKQGTLLFIISCGSAMLLINRGNDMGWQSNFILGCLLTFVFTCPLLIATERRAAHPILPFAMLCEDPTAVKVVLMSAFTWTAYMGNFFVLPIFLQMARDFSTMEAGLILFCRPLGGFLTSSFISWYMRREGDGSGREVRLHWVIRIGSASMLVAFVTLRSLAHVLVDHNQIRAMVLIVLLMQAGGGTAVSVPAQAILVARMPASRLASITAIMQMIGGVTSMIGMTLMLSSVRATWAPGDGEADPESYKVVWVIAAALSLTVHLVSWTIHAGSQHKYQAVARGATSAGGGGGGGGDGPADASVYSPGNHVDADEDDTDAMARRESEKASLLRNSLGSGSDDSGDDEDGARA